MLGDARLYEIMGTPSVNEYRHSEVVNKPKESECVESRGIGKGIKANLAEGGVWGGGYGRWGNGGLRRVVRS